MDATKNFIRARRDFTFAAIMFAATGGSALWLGNSMDEGETLDLHSRLPKTVESQDFATHGENLLLLPCALFTVLSGWNFHYRQRKYGEAQEKLSHS